MKLLTEVREWVSFALGAIALLLTWRWRPRKERPEMRRDVTIRPPAGQADWSMPTPAMLDLHPSQGVGGGSLVLTTGDFGTQAVLNSMAELDPDFPQF